MTFLCGIVWPPVVRKADRRRVGRGASMPASVKEQRGITTLEWRPPRKNSLLGFVRLLLPSRLIINDAMIHERNESRWVALSAREWTDTTGVKRFYPLIEFADDSVRERF